MYELQHEKLFVADGTVVICSDWLRVKGWRQGK